MRSTPRHPHYIIHLSERVGLALEKVDRLFGKMSVALRPPEAVTMVHTTSNMKVCHHSLQNIQSWSSEAAPVSSTPAMVAGRAGACTPNGRIRITWPFTCQCKVRTIVRAIQPPNIWHAARARPVSGPMFPITTAAIELHCTPTNDKHDYRVEGPSDQIKDGTGLH